MDPTVHVFGGYRLDAARRSLIDPEGAAVKLTGKAFDALVYLVEHRGEVVDRATLFQALWPKRVVEDNNLNQTIAAIRRGIGDEHVVTVAGRGYQFVTPLSSGREDDDRAAPLPSRLAARRLPVWARYALPGVAFAIAGVVLNRYAIDRAPDDSARAATATSAVIAPVPARSKSVAVLPFSDLSEGSDSEWLAAGLTDDILNSLTQLPELLVTARTSSFQFGGGQRDIKEIAERLGVAYVVVGSVRRIDNRLRVTAQLIRAADGFYVWSETYERTTDDLFAVESDVAEKVATALNVVLDDTRRAALRRSGTTSIDAFEAAQKGWAIYRALHWGLGGGTLWDANVHFDRALGLDPTYASAAMGASDAFTHQLRGESPESAYTPDQAAERLKEYLEIVIDHGTGAMRLTAEIRRELMSPTWYGVPRLIEQVRSDFQRGELNAEALDEQYVLFDVLALTGNQDLARDIARSFLAADPLLTAAWSTRARVELWAGNFELADELADEGFRKTGGRLDHIHLYADALRGRRRAVIERLGASNPPLVAALQGDRDRAIALAEEIERNSASPPVVLLLVYDNAGAADRVRNLAARIDAEPGGPALLAGLTANLTGLVFDLDDTPRFRENARQAGFALKRQIRLSEMDRETEADGEE